MYQIFYTKNPNSDLDSQLICNGYAIKENGILCNFDTSLAEDGFGYLKLLVYNLDGDIAQDIAYIDIKNIEIVYPEHESSIIEEAYVEIKGTAYDKNFLSFDILVNGTGEDIELTNNGLKPVISGTLGIWNIGNYSKSGPYSLQLWVNTASGTKFFVIQPYIDLELNRNWLKNIGKDVYSPPVIKDIDNDGKEEFVFRDYTGFVHVLDDDGNYFNGWPKQVGGDCGWLCPSAPAVEDLDGDGLAEIIIQSSDAEYSNSLGYITSNKIYILDINGVIKKETVLADSNFTSSIPTLSPVIEDLDSDGKYEIISAWMWRLYILDNLGDIKELLYAFHRDENKKIISNPVVADLDENPGDLEIAVQLLLPEFQQYLYVINSDGSDVSGWPVKLPSTSFSGGNSSVIGDLDGDAKNEIIVSFSANKASIAVFNQYGTLLNGWPQKIDSTPPIISLADLDNNGDLEVVTSNYYGIRAFKRDGTPIEMAEGSIKGINASYGPNAIGDIFELSQGKEIISGSVAWNYAQGEKGKLFYWNSSGEILHEQSRAIDTVSTRNKQDSFYGTPIISDFNKDGLIDIFFISSKGTVYLWNLNNEYDASQIDWPQFQNDSEHTGYYKRNSVNGDGICAIKPSRLSIGESTTIKLNGIRWKITYKDNVKNGVLVMVNGIEGVIPFSQTVTINGLPIKIQGVDYYIPEFPQKINLVFGENPDTCVDCNQTFKGLVGDGICTTNKQVFKKTETKLIKFELGGGGSRTIDNQYFTTTLVDIIGEPRFGRLDGVIIDVNGKSKLFFRSDVGKTQTINGLPVKLESVSSDQTMAVLILGENQDTSPKDCSIKLIPPPGGSIPPFNPPFNP